MWLGQRITGILVATLASISAAMAQEKLKVFNTFNDENAIVVDHDPWDEFLSAYIRTLSDGRTVVDYGAVSKADHTALKDYLGALQAVSVTTLNREEAFVYWVNLYNALTVDVILDNYPLKSIRNIFSGFRPGPWKRQLATIEGVTVSLDEIEHGILRAFWLDNRVHYAVNCASVGCPNLLGRAYRAADLDKTLDAAARTYVNHPRGFRIEENGVVVASSIYNWFRSDFGGSDATIISHLTKYAEPPLAQTLQSVTKIDRFEYDWKLNDVPRGE